MGVGARRSLFGVGAIDRVGLSFTSVGARTSSSIVGVGTGIRSPFIVVVGAVKECPHMLLVLVSV